jgi:hypothetical protein
VPNLPIDNHLTYIVVFLNIAVFWAMIVDRSTLLS